MKRIVLAVGVAIAAVLVGVSVAAISAHHHGTAPRSAHQPSPGRAASVVQTLEFVSKGSTDHYVDAKPTGLSAGDVLAQHSVWYQNGSNVGTMALTATVTQRTSAQTGEVMFTAVASLEGGDVAMTGSFHIVPQNQTFHAAITGGTGTYANVRGTAVFRQVSANVTRVTLSVSS